MTAPVPSSPQPQPVIHITAAVGAQIESSLSPIALKSSGNGTAREVYRSRQIDRKGTSGTDRLPFEHDRDRILHCRQFRKLAGKTQLLIAPNRGDLRTRLTHTMEVYQIATSMGRRFNLNIPAVEAIALGHDVGHTPFGHAGEAALDKILEPIGGFHHAAHSVRTLDRASYDSHILHAETTCGLNLTAAVREGILRHGWFEGRRATPYHQPPLPTREWDLAGPGTRRYGSVEAQVVRLADQISYLNHDIDDLVLYGFEKIVSKRIVGEFFEKHKVAVLNTAEYADWQLVQQNFLELLADDASGRVKTLVRDAVTASLLRIKGVVEGETAPDADLLVEFGSVLRKTRNLFYDFFKECVYTDIRIKHKNESAKNCVKFLYDFFESFFGGNHDLLPMHVQGELGARPPWWQTYLVGIGVGSATVVANATSWTEAVNLTVACKLAAADVVADLTDREALAAAQALDEAESTAGMEALDRILATFPSGRQAELNQQRQDATRRELRGLFPVAGN